MKWGHGSKFLTCFSSVYCLKQALLRACGKRSEKLFNIAVDLRRYYVKEAVASPSKSNVRLIKRYNT